MNGYRGGELAQTARTCWTSVAVAFATSIGCLVATPSLAQTCGSQWLNGAIPALNGTVYATTMWDPDGPGPKIAALVAGGTFTLAGAVNVSNLAMWDGVTWADVGGGVSGSIHGTTAVNALAVMPNGDLVVGGAFDQAGSGGGHISAACIARYNSTTWSQMSLGAPTASSRVVALSVRPNGDLLALGGPFENSGAPSAAPLAVWNDADVQQWRNFGSPVLLPQIESLRTVYSLASGDVVIGGVQGPAAGASAAWRWNASQSSWQNFGSGVGGTSPLNQVFAVLQVAGGDIVLAGNFTNAGGTPVNSIARWNGAQFSALGTGITYPGQPFLLVVHCLSQMPNGDIVAGGNFNTAGGNVGGNVARWNGSSWNRLPQGAGNIVYSLRRTAQDELIIGGAYTFAGGSFANKYIARFTDSGAPWSARQPAAQSVAAHETVVLNATPANGYVNVSVHWKRNGVDISDGAGGASVGGGTVSGAAASLASPTNGAAVTLTITGAQASDSGTYTAVFSNTCGSGSSTDAIVTISSPCLGDLNADNQVDDADFSIFAPAYNLLDCADPAMPVGCPADLNLDGFVDDADFVLFVNAYNALVCP